MAQFKILMIITSAAQMGDGGESTCLWFEELATPYYSFIDAGGSVRLASIAEGPAPIDPRSVKDSLLIGSPVAGVGRKYESVTDFQPFAVASGRLVTGQNPASSALTAKLVFEALTGSLNRSTVMSQKDSLP